jgi:hypothetical protein
MTRTHDLSVDISEPNRFMRMLRATNSPLADPKLHIRWLALLWKTRQSWVSLRVLCGREHPLRPRVVIDGYQAFLATLVDSRP